MSSGLQTARQETAHLEDAQTLELTHPDARPEQPARDVPGDETRC